MRTSALLFLPHTLHSSVPLASGKQAEIEALPLGGVNEADNLRLGSVLGLKRGYHHFGMQTAQVASLNKLARWLNCMWQALNRDVPFRATITIL